MTTMHGDLCTVGRKEKRFLNLEITQKKNKTALDASATILMRTDEALLHY